MIKYLIKPNDYGKVSLGNGFHFKSDIYNFNGYNGVHKGLDISCNGYKDISIYNFCFEDCYLRTGSTDLSGKYAMLWERLNFKLTGNVVFVCHFDSFNEFIMDKMLVKLGTKIGVVGSTGLVLPKGYIHAHIELRQYNLESWKHIKVEEIGHLKLKE